MEQIEADLRLPENTRAARIVAFTPESPEPVSLKFEQADGRVRFTVPGFLVYAVVSVSLEPLSK